MIDHQLKPGQYFATCQDCEKQGIEDANDPFPNMCPQCLEDRLAASFGFDLGHSRPARVIKEVKC